MKMEDLGYTPFFEEKRAELGFSDLPVARVVSESRGAYRVKNTDGEYLARVTGKQMFEASSREDYPAVGDWVVLEELDERNAIIRAVLPRSTILKRKYKDKNRSGEKSEAQIIAANIDVAFVVESVDRDYSLNRFERYFAIAKSGGVQPVIVLNKTDLLSEEELEEKLSELRERFPDVHILSTSTVDDGSFDEIEKYIASGKTYCFLGSSGVGKSSLINRLLHKEMIRTGDISAYSGRGRHVTTKRQMYFLENGPDVAVGAGGIVIDNPGIREVGIIDADKGVSDLFEDIEALGRECRYANCTHIHEPDCEVVRAVESGKLDRGRYSNYINLRKETEYSGMSDLQKKEKDRRFGKFVKNAKKELKDLGHKDW